jgi:branched-chain amino acid transport system substrate-binding protein
MLSIVRKLTAMAVISLASTAMTSGAWAQDAVQGVSADKVVKLGTWAPRSGPLAGLAPSGIDGAYVVFDEINKEGGVNGYTIDVVEVDDGYEPGRTVAAARKLWEQDKVFMIFFPYGSATTKAASRYVIDNDVPLLFTYGNVDSFHAGVSPNVYDFYPRYEQMVSAIAQFAVKNLEAKKIGITYTHGEFGEAGERALKSGAAQHGYELGLETGYALNETNFVSIGRKIAESGDDATLLWNVVGGVQIMAAAEQAGYKGDWLISTVLIGRAAEAEYRKISSLKNRIYLTNFQRMANEDSPDMKEFVEKVSTKFPDADINIALMGYTNAKVFVEALDRATKNGEALTWPGFQQALESIDGEDIGASVNLSYANDNRVGNSSSRIYQWDGDTWTPASDFTPFPEN